jgi:hypothetical protein
MSYTCFVSKNNNTSKLKIWLEVLYDSFKYNISIIEYFQFGFYVKNSIEKTKWAGTGTMYEYQLIMNPKSKRTILDNKAEFVKKYSKFIEHISFDIDELKSDSQKMRQLLNNPSGKIVLKLSNGKCGKQVRVMNAVEFDSQDIISYMQHHGLDLAEEYIIQHSELNRLSSSAVNTVRVITQLDSNDNVDILGCRLRISVNSDVDNMAAGNLAAFIDEKTGEVTSFAFYSDITKAPVEYHPITKSKIKGFEVPNWDKIINMTKEAALLNTDNRSIGWDVVITEKGPELLEGNHDWCKLLWQLPAQKGMKPVLDKYLESMKSV